MTSTCVRRAWLTLGSLSVPLEDEAAGYFCTSLDLGFPDIRDVVNVNPDRDGAVDRTRYLGARNVTAAITALEGAGAQIDAAASAFAPFMAPSARPVLHYILDRPGAAERTLTLRGAGYAWPIAGPYQRDINLSWVAADPVARDPTVQTLTTWSGSSTQPGRTYPFTFNRVYPPGGGAANSVIVSSPGDVAVTPLVRIYGPVTRPTLYWRYLPSGPLPNYNFSFLATFTLAAGEWVDIDAARRTVFKMSDRNQNALGQVDWSATLTWPWFPPLPYTTLVQLNGTSTTGVTQAQVIYQDGYLT